MLSDSEPEIVICDPKYFDLVSGIGPKVIPFTFS